jgi:hypothetical protein
MARLQGTTRSRFIRRIIEDYIENGTLYKLAVNRLRDKNDPILTHKEFEKELRGQNNVKKEIAFDKTSPLQMYTYEWLKNRGLFDEDSDYGGMMGEAVLELVKTFAEQGHSGFSAGMTRFLFNQVLSDFETGKIQKN